MIAIEKKEPEVFIETKKEMTHKEFKEKCKKIRHLRLDQGMKFFKNGEKIADNSKLIIMSINQFIILEKNYALFLYNTNMRTVQSIQKELGESNSDMKVRQLVKL